MFLHQNKHSKHRKYGKNRPRGNVARDLGGQDSAVAGGPEGHDLHPPPCDQAGDGQRGCAEFGPTRDQTIAVPANSVRLSRLFVVISRVIGHGSG